MAFLTGKAPNKTVDLTKSMRALEETTRRRKSSKETPGAGTSATKETAGLEAGLGGARKYLT